MMHDSQVWHGVRNFLGGSPSRSAMLVFVAIMLAVAGLLSMPFASAHHRVTPFYDALFTSVSAMSVTGLTTVNTAEHWSTAGQVVLLSAMQVGGLGILSIAALLSQAVSHRLGLRSRLLTQQGLTTGRLGEVPSLLTTVVVSALVLESALVAVLVPRFAFHSGSWAEGWWHGVFYAISAFNNAGFSLHPDGAMAYLSDPWIMWALTIGVYVGALGFPVILILYRWVRRRGRWNLHTKLTVEVTLGLMVIGAVLLAWFEWSNPDTLGEHGFWQRLQLALFSSVMTRSGGFSVYDIAEQNPESLLLMDALMFIGGGSGSTAGGIKVTTLAVLLLAIVAEARGDQEAKAHRRTITDSTIRVAIAVVMLGATLVLISSLVLISISGESLQRVLFESLSAFGTVGLSTGFSAELPPAGKYVLCLLMFAGRLGTITFAAGLALRQRRTLYRHPEERPIIG